MVQGAILAFTGVLVRMIGLAYRVPLARIVGEEGMGIYATAFNLYSIMLLLSSYSLPLAVSKMVSARIAKGGHQNALRILKAALLYATLVGGLASAITFFGAGTFARFLFHMPLAEMALTTLAPTIWVMAYLGVFRGYFQGHSTMVPTAISQILEQIANAGVSVFAAWYLCKTAAEKYSNIKVIGSYGAAGGTIGTGAGAVVALLFMLGLFLLSGKSRRALLSRGKRKKLPLESYSKITGILIITVVPVIASTAIYNINSILDNILFGIAMNYLDRKEDIEFLYGVYAGEYLVLINLPVAISNALSSSLIPALSRSWAENARGMVNAKIAVVIKLACIVSMPCAVGLAVLAEPIMNLLFSKKEGTQVAAYLMMMGSATIVLYSISTITNAVLQGTNHLHVPVKNAARALVYHFIVLGILLFLFRWDVVGIVFGNMAFALFMCILNAGAIRKYLAYKQEIFRTYILPAFCSGVMGVAVHFSYQMAKRHFHRLALQTLIPIALAIPVYLLLLVITKTLTEAELSRIPGGRLVIGFYKALRLM